MNIAIADDELVGLVELLAFIAQLCHAEEPLVSAALARFCGVDAYGATELNVETTHWADVFAQLLGFADASLEPAS